MKVSKGSWHYRLYRFWRNTASDPFFVWERYVEKKMDARDYVPKSLCSYFWTIMLMSTLGALLLLILGAIFGLSALVLYPIYLYANSDWRTRRQQEKAERREKKGMEPKKKQPSLVGSFLKARKQKVCPMIELVD